MGPGGRNKADLQGILGVNLTVSVDIHRFVQTPFPNAYGMDIISNSVNSGTAIDEN